MKIFARFSLCMAVLIALTRLATPASAGVVFNFDSDTVGTAAPFTDTVGTLQATFSGPSAGVCSISPLGLVLQSGNAFISGLCLGTTPPFVPLDIAFGQNVYGITLDFALNLPDTLVFTALENGVVVGTSSSSGSVLGGGTFLEGTLGFSGVFDSVSLSTSGTAISIDNVNVQDVAAAVPEPAGLAWLGCALLGFAVRWRRR